MDIFKGMPYGIKEIITNRMIASVAISPTGALIPLLDTAAITAIWANTACGSSILGYLGGSKALNWLLNLIPGVGTLGAMAGNVIFNGYYTYAIGKAFHLMLEDYDINGKTIIEMAKILVRLFVPIPSVGELKEIFRVMKDQL